MFAFRARATMRRVIRRCAWRALAATGLAVLKQDPPPRGVHMAQWRGPNGEMVLIPIQADGRAAVHTPLFARDPTEFADAMDRCWHLLEAADAQACVEMERELADAHRLPPDGQQLLRETLESLAATAPERREKAAVRRGPLSVA